MGDTCLFCLEETSQDNIVILVDFTTYAEVPCSCRLHSHVGCWMSYYMSKGGFECPICHSRIIITPTVPRPRQMQAIIVRVNDDSFDQSYCRRGRIRLITMISSLLFLILIVTLYLRRS